MNTFFLRSKPALLGPRDRAPRTVPPGWSLFVASQGASTMLSPSDGTTQDLRRPAAARQVKKLSKKLEVPKLEEAQARQGYL